MKQELEKVNWVRDATPWSQETAFIVGNLLREMAKKDKIIRQQEHAIRALSKRLLEK